MRQWIALLIGIFVSAYASAPKADTGVSQCSVPARATKKLADIPAPILAKMPGLGAPDGPIRTDALVPNEARPATRLVSAFSRQDLWAVAYEKGGIGTQQMVATFKVDGTQATLIGQHEAFREGGYCAVLGRIFYSAVRP